MGTDIHGVFQRRNPETKQWEDIPHKYEMNRHYQLFAMLAGVRNGTGFAGVKTGEPVKPISEPRGVRPGRWLQRLGRDGRLVPAELRAGVRGFLCSMGEMR